MEDRIKIGDDWYIKESTVTPTREKLTESDITYTVGAVLEDDDYLFDFSALNMGDGITMPAITYTNKIDNRNHSCMDNPEWLIRLGNRDILAMAQVRDDIFDEEVIELLIDFINILIRNHWLTEDM